ncbi:MAG: hypothetical protein R3E82_13565 [Pseudomonadales bacterium]|nr:hypothetical protein [Pseudomonadales bacterium]
MRRVLLIACLCSATSALGYEASTHQYLTFFAARHFNHCVTETDIPRLTPLEVRYMARASAGVAETGFFLRMFRWNYYDPKGQSGKNLLWLVETRFHKHFNELTEGLERTGDPVDAYRDLGRLLGYIQMVTSPAHAVPVFTARFWRFSFSDRFDNHPVDEAGVELRMIDDCSFLEGAGDVPGESIQDVLVATAERTIASVRETIPGIPATWEAFWMPSRRGGDFGEYGDAGNSFGRRVEFRCGGAHARDLNEATQASDAGGSTRQHCVLLNDDPLYDEFALARHVDAIRASLRVMLIMQTGKRLSLPAVD